MQRKEKQAIAVGASILFIASLAIYLNSLNGVTQTIERKVATGKMKLIKTGNMTQTFTYENSTVSADMIVECVIPASIKINTLTMTTPGNIEIYINENNYATGIITKTGYAQLASGCGCSTVCICEIKSGENVLTIVSRDFEGEIEYEISVKEG